MNTRQFIRYAFSSGLTWFVDFIAFMALYRFFGIPGSLLLSRCLAGAVGYCCHKWYSFESKTQAVSREIVGYIGLASINYVLSVALVQSVTYHSDIQVVSVKICADVAIFVANFLFLQKLFVTGKNSNRC